jgi:hypothetical protein
MTSYENDSLRKDATDYIDWYKLDRERRETMWAESSTVYPEPFITNDDL